jgi:NitT/TauT family transport system substrate-binding protein
MLQIRFKTLLATAAVVGLALSASASAQDVVRHGIQIGALGALRTTLPEVGKKYNLKFEIKNFRSSTSALRALDQGELQIANTTAQHLVRAISEGIDVVWVAGWGGGYNVLVAGKNFKSLASNKAALKAAIMKRKGSNPVKVGVPTGSMQHAKLLGYMKSIGIDGEKDIQIVNISFPNHPRALGAGEVDMAMTLAGFGQLAIEKSGAAMVDHIFKGQFGKQEIGFLVQRKLIKSNPDLVQRIVKAHVEAMDMFINDMGQQVAWEKKYSRFPPTVIETTERTYLRYSYRTNVSDLKTMAKLLKTLGWSKVDQSLKIEGMLNFGFLSKATGKPAAALKNW